MQIAEPHLYGIKLITGETLACYVGRLTEDSTSVVLHRPLVVMQGGGHTVSLIPWMLPTDSGDGKVEVRTGQIISVYKLDQRIAYLHAFSWAAFQNKYETMLSDYINQLELPQGQLN